MTQADSLIISCGGVLVTAIVLLATGYSLRVMLAWDRSKKKRKQTDGK